MIRSFTRGRSMMAVAWRKQMFDAATAEVEEFVRAIRSTSSTLINLQKCGIN